MSTNVNDTIPVLYGWKAKRSGGRITITHASGKIGAVDTIEMVPGGARADGVPAIFATTSQGKTYKLES